jgi:hypothetical protein
MKKIKNEADKLAKKLELKKHKDNLIKKFKEEF